MGSLSQLGASVCSFVSISTAPILFLLCLWKNRRLYWRMAFPVGVMAAWLAGAASTTLYHNHLWDQIQRLEARNEEVPNEIREDHASDTSVMAMTMFGWIFGLFYAGMIGVFLQGVSLICEGFALRRREKRDIQPESRLE